MGRLLSRYCWGFVFAGTYIAVAASCIALHDGAEYSVPAYVWYFSSVPSAWVFAHLYKAFPHTPISLVFFRMAVMAAQSIIYFGLGQAVAKVVRACRLARKNASLDQG